VTTYNADEWRCDALPVGACSYLLKDSEGHVIVAAIRGAMAGAAGMANVKIFPLWRRFRV
jgi:DNA-binding NarL/FixJ family response regulator